MEKCELDPMFSLFPFFKRGFVKCGSGVTCMLTYISSHKKPNRKFAMMP